jgi:hypothetical protein
MENIFTDDLDLLNEDSTIDLDEDQDLALDFSIGLNECAVELMVETSSINLVTSESFIGGMKDKIKAAIEAIKRFFQKVWKKITEYYNKVVSFLFNWEKRNAKWVKDHEADIKKAAATSGSFNFKSIMGENPLHNVSLQALDHHTSENSEKALVMISTIATTPKEKIEETLKNIRENQNKGKDRIKSYESNYNFSVLKEIPPGITTGNIAPELKKGVAKIGSGLQKSRDLAIKALEKDHKENENLSFMISSVHEIVNLYINGSNLSLRIAIKGIKEAYAFIKKGVSEAKKVNRTA